MNSSPVTPKSITTRGGARYNMHMHTQSPKTARGVRLYEYIIKTKSCRVSRGGGRDHPQREDQRRPTRTPRTRKNPRTRKSSLVEAMVEGLVLCQKNCITSYERTMCLSAYCLWHIATFAFWAAPVSQAPNARGSEGCQTKPVPFALG